MIDGNVCHSFKSTVSGGRLEDWNISLILRLILFLPFSLLAVGFVVSRTLPELVKPTVEGGGSEFWVLVCLF
jgi:hypothetical protein